MAGTTFDNTADAGSTQTDRASRLNSLLEQVRARPTQVGSPAQRIVVEVDGISVAESDAGPTRTYALPSDARNVTLRDENGAARAYLMVEGSDAIAELAFDEGRIELTLERGDSQLSLTVAHTG